MSSSHRTCRPCDGVLIRDQQPISPLRLPAKRSEDFVAQFNRTYARVGLSIELVDREDEQAPAQESDPAQETLTGGQ